MYKCDFCNDKEYFRKRNLILHQKNCVNNPEKLDVNCPHCDKKLEKTSQLGPHILWCIKNPNSKTENILIALLKNSKKQIHSEERKNRMSNTINKKIENGDWHLSFSKSRTIEYKGIKWY